MKSDSCTFLKKDHLGHVQFAVMAYVEYLALAGSAQMGKDFISVIQEEFTVKHVNFLTSENPVEVHWWVAQDRWDHWQSRNRRTQTSGSFRRSKGSVRQSHLSEVQDSCRKPLWMAQLRDDLKHPVKELSRSLINPQDQDIKNLIHLLKYVNQSRDVVFVMEPQLPARKQYGKFLVQIVRYSGSDWAGCQNF